MLCWLFTCFSQGNTHSEYTSYAPVLSFVIYLKKDRSVAKSPLVVALPDGGEVHRFKFTLVELYKVPTEQLKQTGLVGLLPLI